MLVTKQKGNLTELRCITAFYELGYVCSIPYGDNSRYDFIADIDGQLIRVQCKTSHLISDSKINFSCRSTSVNAKKNKRHRYTSREIDYFATYWDGQCYLVPVTECSVEKILNLQPTKNNQQVGVAYAADYELCKQIENIKGKH